MAEFVAIPTTFTDAHALVAALADLGLSQIAVNERPVPLRDVAGQPQNYSAELIIHRENNPEAQADLGFKRGQSGLFLLVVSAPDRTRYTGIWLRQLNQRYRYHVASGRLQERGFSLVKLGESVSGITQNPVQSSSPKIEALQPQGFWGSLLHMVVPGWVERHTVEILARQPQTPRAARTLAEVVVHFDYEPSHELAFQALQQLADRRCIDQVCEVWASMRHPDLARLLVEQGWTASAPASLKVLTALKTERVERLNDLNPKDVGLLLQACDDIEPDVAEGAQAYLRELENPALLDALCELWAEGRDPFLWELIQRKKYLPRRPISTRVLVGLKLGMGEIFAGGKANVVAPLVDACADSDEVIAEAAKQTLRQLKRNEARQALCEIIINQAAPVAQQIALEEGYLPDEPYRRALFFFVTEQWDKYEALDFDHNILRTAYETASPALQRRLAEKIRLAGRADYLQAITGGDYRARAAELSAEEAELLVQILAANREWAKLWSLVFELPLDESVQIISQLSQASWQPEREDERAVFEQLKPLALTRLEYDRREINRKLLPLAIFRARARVPSRVNALAFSPTRPVIAVGTGAGKVVLWNLQRAERELLLSGFEHSVGQLVFTSANILACAERTSTEDGICNLYIWPGEGTNLVKLGQHKGSITALLATGETQVLSAGRDHKVTLWDAATRTRLKTAQLEDWPRTACISSSGQEVALFSERNVTFLELPQLSPTGQLAGRALGVARTAVFTPDEKALLTGKFSGGLGLCLRKEQTWRNVTALPGSLSEITGPVTELALVPGQSLLLVATTDGTIRFLDWAGTPNLLGTIQAPGTRLTSLTVSPDGAFMAVGDSDASFTLWDLRVLELGQLFEQPLAQARPRQLAALTALLESGAELPTSLKALLGFAQVALRHRFRFAIELAEATPDIQAGEFDIEIEG